jgi:ribosome biogenesis protein MAK21
MKLIVVRAIEEFLVHTHDIHTQYYAIITLNQVILTRNDVQVANRLVDLYFTYFHAILKRQQNAQLEQRNTKNQPKKSKKQLERERKAELEQQLRMSVEAKMIAQLLTGVNRALPFAKMDDEV